MVNWVRGFILREAGTDLAVGLWVIGLEKELGPIGQTWIWTFWTNKNDSRKKTAK